MTSAESLAQIYTEFWKSHSIILLGLWLFISAVEIRYSRDIKLYVSEG